MTSTKGHVVGTFGSIERKECVRSSPHERYLYFLPLTLTPDVGSRQDPSDTSGVSVSVKEMYGGTALRAGLPGSRRARLLGVTDQGCGRPILGPRLVNEFQMNP